MFSAHELAALQAVAANALDIADCKIQRVARANDGHGSQSETWNTLATVACSLAKPTAAVMQAYTAQVGGLATWIVSLPFGTAIQRDDRLIIASQGLTLRVEVDLSQSSYSTLTQVLASEIR